MPVPTRVVSVALAVTAVVNLVAGVSAVVLPELNVELLIGPGVVLEDLTLRYHWMVWTFVGAMSAGYVVAALDPERQTALILAAGLGKLSAAVIWIEMLLSGLGTPLLIGGIVFDGPLGLLFLAFAIPRVLERAQRE